MLLCNANNISPCNINIFINVHSDIIMPYILMNGIPGSGRIWRKERGNQLLTRLKTKPCTILHEKMVPIEQGRATKG